MLRTLNSIIAAVGALALILSVGGCAGNEAAENASIENVAEDLNLSTENAVEDMNAVENDVAPAGNEANLIVPPFTDPQPPATDTGPDDAEEGLGAFRELSDMEVDNWYTVEFFVAPEGEGPDKAEGLARESGNAELTAPAFVYVAPAMRVTLNEDPEFEIRPKSPDIVITGPDKSATWLWNVKPLTGGEQTLYATVEVLQRNPDGSLKKNADGSYAASRPKTRSANVTVKVGTWKGFLIALQNAGSLGDVLSTLFNSWQKALAALALLIGAAGGVWLAIRNFGKPKAPAQPAQPVTKEEKEPPPPGQG